MLLHGKRTRAFHAVWPPVSFRLGCPKWPPTHWHWSWLRWTSSTGRSRHDMVVLESARSKIPSIICLELQNYKKAKKFAKFFGTEIIDLKYFNETLQICFKIAHTRKVAVGKVNIGESLEAFLIILTMISKSEYKGRSFNNFSVMVLSHVALFSQFRPQNAVASIYAI